MKFLFLISLLPLTLSLPQPQNQLDIPRLYSVRHNTDDKRAFGAGAGDDAGIAGTSVVGDKDTSTLTSLVVFKPSSSPSSPSPSKTASQSGAEEDEASQIVSPFYPITSDDDSEAEDKSDQTSLKSLNQGETAAFNPTPSTTLSLLTNNLATSTQGAQTQSGSASGVVVAAASHSGNSTVSASERSVGSADFAGVIGLGGMVGIIVSSLI